MEHETKVFRRGGSKALHIPAGVQLQSDKVRIVQTPTGFRVIDPLMEEKAAEELEVLFSKLKRGKPRGRPVRS